MWQHQTLLFSFLLWGRGIAACDTSGQIKPWLYSINLPFKDVVPRNKFTRSCYDFSHEIPPSSLPRALGPSARSSPSSPARQLMFCLPVIIIMSLSPSRCLLENLQIHLFMKWTEGQILFTAWSWGSVSGLVCPPAAHVWLFWRHSQKQPDVFGRHYNKINNDNNSASSYFFFFFFSLQSTSTLVFHLWQFL